MRMISTALSFLTSTRVRRPAQTHSRDLSDGIASYPLLVCRYRSGPVCCRSAHARRPAPRPDSSPASGPVSQRALREGEPLLDRRERSEGCFCLRLPNGVRHYLSAGWDHGATTSIAIPVESRTINQLQSSPPGTLDAETSVAHTMAERTRQVVRATKAISYAAFWQGETVALTIDWHSGLWLNRDYRGDVSTGGRRPGRQTPLHMAL